MLSGLDGSAVVKVDAATQERSGITVAPLTPATHQAETAAFGRLESDPSRTFAVRAPVAGVVRAAAPLNWPALGDTVVPGQVIGWIEPRFGPAERVDLVARLASARAEAEEAAASLAAARASYDHKRPLNGESKIVSDRALEEAEAKVKGEEARLQAANETVRLIEEAYTGEAGRALPLRAERGGEVIELGVQPGEAVEAGQVLVRLEDYDSLLVRLVLPVGETVDPANNHARVLVVGAEQSPLDGERLAQVCANPTHPQGQVVLYRVPTRGLPLRPGAAAIGYLPAPGGARRGVEIPRSGVVRDRGRAWVYLQTDNESFTRREVPTSDPTALGWFTESGFHPGDRVVVEGAHVILSEELRPRIEQEEAAEE